MLEKLQKKRSFFAFFAEMVQPVISSPISFTGVGCIDVALLDGNRKRIEHLDVRHE